MIIKKILRLLTLRIKYIKNEVVLNSYSIGKNVDIGNGSSISFGCILNNNIHIGKGCKLASNVVIGGGYLSDYVSVNRNTIIDFAHIGNFVSIGPNCHIGPGNHAIEYISSSQRLYAKNNILGIDSQFNPYTKECTIGNDVWIGSNVIILQGVHIGNGAVVGAGSVVTHNVPDYAIVVGNPAKILKMRFDKKRIKYLITTDLFGSEYARNTKIIKQLILEGSEWQCPQE